MEEAEIELALKEFVLELLGDNAKKAEELSEVAALLFKQLKNPRR